MYTAGLCLNCQARDGMTQLSQKQVVPKCDELKQLVASWFALPRWKPVLIYDSWLVKVDRHSSVVLEFCHEWTAIEAKTMLFFWESEGKDKVWYIIWSNDKKLAGNI